MPRRTLVTTTGQKIFVSEDVEGITSEEVDDLIPIKTDEKGNQTKESEFKLMFDDGNCLVGSLIRVRKNLSTIVVELKDPKVENGLMFFPSLKLPRTIDIDGERFCLISVDITELSCKLVFRTI